MRLWSRMKARMSHLNERVASAEQLNADADAQVTYSQERQNHVRETVIAPMNQAAVHNQFSDLIRASLSRQAQLRRVTKNRGA